MTDGRKRWSGSEYKKRAKEKQAKESALLEKIPKLGDFFTRTTSNYSTAAATPGPADGVQAIDDVDSPVNVIGIQTDTEDAAAPGPTTTPVCASEVMPVPLQSNVEFTGDIVISSDPAKWIINDATRNYVAKHGVNQNLNADFTCTKRQYPDNKVRVLNKTLFSRTLVNGEVKPRPWLVFSKSLGAIFCAACRLFGKTSALATKGYSDWKNASQHLKEHENSLEHRSSTISLIQLGNTKERIDKELVTQMEKEIEYWRNVLKRVVAAVRSLAIRGLPFRGDDERFGSYHSGNFIMTLELIAEFDPFLAEHIRHYGNIGSGKTSYLSYQTCNEFVSIMSEHVIKIIVQEVINAKYFSISVDSTPDISHTDQLSFIIRYVSKDGIPVERFLKFIPNIGHKSQQLATTVLDTLKGFNLDIANCRGQSYDNASNMSGAYSGLQARIKEVNPSAVYVPCAAHSLNLVGTCAADCCEISITFFGFLQELYNFFTASTHRWEVLLYFLNQSSESKVVKSLSKTRWSARYEAALSLYMSWDEIKKALESITEDVTQKTKTRHDAAALLMSLNRLEIAIMTVFWKDILERLHAVNKKLQSVNIELGMVVTLYGSLEQYIYSIRDQYDEYEEKAIKLSGKKEYRKDLKRSIKHKDNFNETRENEAELTGKNDFRVRVFCVIIDRLVGELSRRKSAYKDLCAKFDFLTNLQDLTSEAILEKEKNLVSFYPEDLDESSFGNECLHLQSHLNFIGGNKKSALELCKMLHENELLDVYPNISIALRILLCTFATNCSAERSFSALKRIKTYLRSTTGNDRLNKLAVLQIESEILRNTDYDIVIDDFARQKSRRKPL